MKWIIVVWGINKTIDIYKGIILKMNSIQNTVHECKIHFFLELTSYLCYFINDSLVQRTSSPILTFSKYKPSEKFSVIRVA